MEESEKEELKAKMDSYGSEINQLRRELNDLTKRRTELFAKKDGVESGVRGELNSLDSLKRDRNSLTRQVRDLKEKRDPINRKIRELIEKIKPMKKDAEKISEKKSKDPKKSIPPRELKREIDAMEFKIETEVFSPKKEQELMKVLKEKKKLYKEISSVGASWGEIRSLSHEIDALKKEANGYHETIQKLAEESQKKHEKIVEILKKIEPIKDGMDAVNNELDKVKMDISIRNTQLKEKLLEIGKISQQLGISLNEDSDGRPRRMSRDEIDKIMETKEKNVEEKIKKRQKLTNEDLLVFQQQSPHQGVHTGHKRRK